jgi:circadian clock protein KaiB
MKKTTKIELTGDSNGSFDNNPIIYELRLYVTGMTPQSLHAIDNLKQICEEYLKGRYNLEVVDLYKNPSLAKGEQIIAAPTLIKKLPLPLRRIIGNMSKTERVIVGLDLRKLSKEPINLPEKNDK